jgi:hypothetical protein
MDEKTRIDTQPDAVTVKQTLDGHDADTHKLDPRVYAPLRVCPQCSLAWETESDWCASCGTAFDARDRESATRVRPGRTGERPAPRNRGTAPSATRNTGERAAAHQAPRRKQQPRASAPAPRRRSAGSFFGWLALFLLIPIAMLAFVAGQNTRPSKAEVNHEIKTAVDQNTRSAVASAQRELQRQKKRLQAEFNDRVEKAESRAFAEGKSNAEAQQPQGGLTDDLKRCLANLFEC